ncbi:MAG: hypothetical protein IT318_02835 [Anaerolineales bacterium]|nr:hypothetical protein [Anaerolineales bacterium]
MRQRHAFLLILIHDDAEPAVLRGRVRHVASETEAAFTGADQLLKFLQARSAVAAAGAVAAAQVLDPAGAGQHLPKTTE